MREEQKCDQIVLFRLLRLAALQRHARTLHKQTIVRAALDGIDLVFRVQSLVDADRRSEHVKLRSTRAKSITSFSSMKE